MFQAEGTAGAKARRRPSAVLAPREVGEDGQHMRMWGEALGDQPGRAGGKAVGATPRNLRVVAGLPRTQPRGAEEGRGQCRRREYKAVF